MFAFDIETIPNSSMLDKLPEPEIKLGALKDPEKIAQKKAEAKIKQIEKMALNPLYGRVCAAVLSNDNACSRIIIDEDSDNAETELLETLFPFFADDNVLITYNGTDFDMPFTYKRAVLLGIVPAEYAAPTLSAMTARYNNKHHIDLMTVWCGYGRYEKLDNLGNFLLDEKKLDVNFRDFPEMIKTEIGRGKLLDYCEQDVRLTWALYQRFKGVLV